MDETNANVKEMPLYVLGDIVLLPGVATSFPVNKIKALAAIGKASEFENLLFVTSQRDPADKSENAAYFPFGCVCRIRKIAQIGGTGVRVFLETAYRAEIISANESGQFTIATVVERADEPASDFDENVSLRAAKSKLQEYSTVGKLAPETLQQLLSIPTLSGFINAVTAEFPFPREIKYSILSTCEIDARFKCFSDALWSLVDIAALEKKISTEVRKSIDKGQREYFLREQLKAVHKELGDDEGEIDELREKLLAKKMPKDVEDKVLTDLQRMSRMSFSSPEYTVLRTYIDAILELPFNEHTDDARDLNAAIDVLNADHFGLEKVKERIIEYLAVLKITGKVSGSILCLVGPPGVGKTSVAASVARALDRKFVRMSLGGVSDEAEIRGHRKTYIGSMPGRIINGLKIAGVNNPVFLLDEIDKLGRDMRGDPAAALLEVLDPEQNKTFRDRYLEIPYDLSNVLFITTANRRETIPEPLLDRMEIIELDGYTREEKIEIAVRYLIPKRLKLNGLTAKNVTFEREAVDKIIKGYTLEAGVRNLERQIDGVIRKIATEFAKNGKFGKRKITPKNLKNYLGAPKFEEDDDNRENLLGAARGLAWTAYGGTTLTIEVSAFKGKGDLVLTGKLGDVMKESARTALSYIEANADKYGVADENFSEKSVHVHVPEGATPKDGPSAGVTIATALLSALSNKEVRGDVAMTGEITLRGNVLPIGGLKEKSLAAYRVGIKNIIIPFANTKDIEDVPENIRGELNFIPVKRADEVFAAAFVNGGEWSNAN